MDLKAIRDRLKTELQTVTGLFVFDTSPAAPPVTLPAAIIAPMTGGFLNEVTMDGVEDLDLVVLVLLQKVVDSAAQDNADTLLSAGASNIANAIDSGHTTDWDYAVAKPARGYGQYVWGEGEGAVTYLGFEIPVEIGIS